MWQGCVKLKRVLKVLRARGMNNDQIKFEEDLKTNKNTFD
ncbi:hypothetical protein EV06_1848 [Prochlorococcus sp. MIT 0602]|nr:hypothetical protein EV06_1848 [Prochlorococcus sp. MIT 0602]KGG15781.1 hypothetical protein EV07_1746 [Prochlorococcus sp. MIT 0603]